MYFSTPFGCSNPRKVTERVLEGLFRGLEMSTRGPRGAGEDSKNERIDRILICGGAIAIVFTGPLPKSGILNDD